MGNPELDRLVKQINKDWKVEEGQRPIAMKGSELPPITYIPTSSPALSYLLGGGWPRGQLLELFGREGAGKTSLAIMFLRDCMRWEKVVQKKPRVVGLIDIEHRFNPSWAETLGFTMDEDFLLIQPSDAEEATDIMVRMIKSNLFAALVFDSIGAALPSYQKEEFRDKATRQGGNAAIMSRCVNTVSPIANRYNVTILFLNQLRADMDGYNRPMTPGGHAVKHAMSLRLYLRPGTEKFYDKITDGVEASTQVGFPVVFKCVAPESRVWVEGEGLVTMDTLVPYQTMDPDSFVDLSGRVQDSTGAVSLEGGYFSGRGRGRTVELETGQRLSGSLDHRVRTLVEGRVGWTRLEDLQVGQQVLCPRHPSSVWGRETCSLGMSRLLGYAVSEGSFSESLFTVSQNPGPVNEDIRSLLESELGLTRPPQLQYQCEKKSVLEKLESLGLTRTKSREKSVPSSVLSGTKGQVQEFLRGLFEGDGSVSGEAISYASLSQRLCEEVQQLLLHLGIVSRLKSYPMGPKDPEHCHHLYIYRESVEAYMESVGFVSQAKLEKGSRLLERRTRSKGTLRYSGVRERVRKAYDTKKSLWRDDSVSYMSLRGASEFSLERLDSWAHKCNSEGEASLGFELLEISRYFPLRVASLEEYEGPLVDLSVDSPSHEYVVEGISSHNTVKNSFGVPLRQQWSNFYFQPSSFLDHVGFDEQEDLQRLGILTGVIEQNGSWYSWGDVKAQGRDAFFEKLAEVGKADQIRQEIESSLGHLQVLDLQVPETEGPDIDDAGV